MENTLKQYLGDEAYINFDSYQLGLTTEDGTAITNTIYLDDSVLRALCRWRARLAERIKESEEQ